MNFNAVFEIVSLRDKYVNFWRKFQQETPYSTRIANYQIWLVILTSMARDSGQSAIYAVGAYGGGPVYANEYSCCVPDRPECKQVTRCHPLPTQFAMGLTISNVDSHHWSPLQAEQAVSSLEITSCISFILELLTEFTVWLS